MAEFVSNGMAVVKVGETIPNIKAKRTKFVFVDGTEEVIIKSIEDVMATLKMCDNVFEHFIELNNKNYAMCNLLYYCDNDEGD